MTKVVTNPFDEKTHPRPYVVTELLLAATEEKPVTMDALHDAVRRADSDNKRGLASRMLAGVLRTLEDEGARFERRRDGAGVITYWRTDAGARVTKRTGNDAKRSYSPGRSSTKKVPEGKAAGAVSARVKKAAKRGKAESTKRTSGKAPPVPEGAKKLRPTRRRSTSSSKSEASNGSNSSTPSSTRSVGRRRRLAKKA